MSFLVSGLSRHVPVVVSQWPREHSTRSARRLYFQRGSEQAVDYNYTLRSGPCIIYTLTRTYIIGIVIIVSRPAQFTPDPSRRKQAVDYNYTLWSGPCIIYTLTRKHIIGIIIIVYRTRDETRESRNKTRERRDKTRDCRNKTRESRDKTRDCRNLWANTWLNDRICIQYKPKELESKLGILFFLFLVDGNVFSFAHLFLSSQDLLNLLWTQRGSEQAVDYNYILRKWSLYHIYSQA